MVDISTVSIGVAPAGVFAAAIYYVFQLRHHGKMRQTDLVIRLSSEFKSREFLEAFVDTFEVEFKDYDDFVKKFGRPISKSQVPMSFMMMGNFFEEIGILFRNGLIDASLVSQLFPISEMWEKMKPVLEGMRREYHDPRLYEWFEYLCNEMQKREQKLQQSKT